MRMFEIVSKRIVRMSLLLESFVPFRFHIL